MEQIEKLAPEKTYQEMTFYADSDDSDTTKNPQKKRGRKNTEATKYYQESERKIAAW